MVEKKLRIRSNALSVLVPLTEDYEASDNDSTMEGDFELREAHTPPQFPISNELETLGIDLAFAPKRWTILGDALIVKFPEGSDKHKTTISRVLAGALRVSSVFEMTGGISGEYREPRIQLLYGPGGSVTHRENGIRFMFDPAKIMFSPGNVNVRTSMRELDLEGKKVIDMFAGIGYFSLGIAKYSSPSEVHSCELNPVSFHYLRKNIELNKLDSIVRAYQGDSRLVMPKMKADAIVMGNFQSGQYLPHALLRLRDGGLILMHTLVSTDSLLSSKYKILGTLKGWGRRGSVQKEVVVKSFGPHVWHVYYELIVEKN